MGASEVASFFKLVLKNFDVLSGPVVSLVYPLYASIQAIETKSAVDDQQWLTYWVLYSMIVLFELTFAKFIEWFPFWSYAKLIFTCWLVIPHFSGAAYVYQHYVRPYLITRQKIVNIWHVPRNYAFGKQDDILTAAEKYIQENGTEAFEKIIHKSRDNISRSIHYSPYEDDYRYDIHKSRDDISRSIHYSPYEDDDRYDIHKSRDNISRSIHYSPYEDDDRYDDYSHW